MSAQTQRNHRSSGARSCSQTRYTRRSDRRSPTQQDALDTLSLAEIEEASGELYRRLATALRSIGERRADDPDAERRSPRQHAASLAATTELAAAALGAIAAGTSGPTERNDRHPTTVAAIMYATPTIAALLTRLEQDRRMLTSLARTLESRFEEQCDSPWGRLTVRRLLTEVALTEAARCARELERRAETAEA
jgi:hypothetical protein